MWWFWLSVACWLATQAADVWLTNAFLAKGIRESNTWMRWLQANWGAWWWVPKGAVALAVAGILVGFYAVDYAIAGAVLGYALSGFYASVVLWQNWQKLRG